MTPSVYSVAFADGMNRKFPEEEFGVEAGRKYDRIYQNKYGSRYIHAFINRETGDLIKSAGWKAPQKNPVTGALAVRFRLDDVEGMTEALEAADVHGSYLYVR